MKVGKVLFALPLVLVAAVLLPSLVYAFPSDEFYMRDADIYDDWGISRTRHKRADGFLGRTPAGLNPMVIQESLGENADLAWQLGEGFAQKYPDRNQRAEQIFYFVRDRVLYTSDIDQFGRDEFAQNADEVAATILESGVAQGDCEDSGVLLAIMYMAAGYRSAIALMPGHVATLVYLPEYKKATRMINVAGENGWVWAEATMRTNPLGWVPESVAKRVITTEVITTQLETQEDTILEAMVQTGLPRTGARSTFAKELVVLVAAIALLLAMVGGGSFARRLGRR